MQNAYQFYLMGDIEAAAKNLWRYENMIGDLSYADHLGNHWRYTDFRSTDNKIWTVVKKNGFVNSLSYEES